MAGIERQLHDALVELASLRAWRSATEKTKRLVAVSEAAARQVVVQRLLIEHFSLEEMRALCFEMNISYEVLGGETRIEKALELVEYCQRRGLLDALIMKCQEHRPHASWPI